MVEVLELRTEYIQAIRDLSVSHVDYWRQVPWLALQADGRTGHLDRYATAFWHGYWTISSSSSGSYYTVYVDLDTGELVSASHVENLARDDDVMRCDPEQLDAPTLVEQLKEAGRKKHGSYYDPKAKIEWRLGVIKSTGLTEVYKRNGPRKNLPFVWD